MDGAATGDTGAASPVDALVWTDVAARVAEDADQDPAGQAWDATGRDEMSDAGCVVSRVNLSVVQVFPAGRRGVPVPVGGSVECPAVLELVPEAVLDPRSGACVQRAWEYTVHDPKTGFWPYVFESWRVYADGIVWGSPDRSVSRQAFLIFGAGGRDGEFLIRLSHTGRSATSAAEPHELGRGDHFVIIDCPGPEAQLSDGGTEP